MTFKMITVNYRIYGINADDLNLSIKRIARYDFTVNNLKTIFLRTEILTLSIL
jgi:hypothetical protein